MRSFLSLVLVAGTGALAACNPYDPSLPPVPFRCGDTDPICPSGYSCNSNNECESDDGGPDADSDVDAGCLDPAEPNDMITSATFSSVYDQMPDIELGSLSLCPAMDVDYFSISQSLNCGGAGPACPNLDVTAVFQDLAVPPTVVIQNATGITVAMGGTTGTAGEIKAVLNNVAQGQYYVRVTAQAVLSNYNLIIDGTRPL